MLSESLALLNNLTATIVHMRGGRSVVRDSGRGLMASPVRECLLNRLSREFCYSSKEIWIRTMEANTARRLPAFDSTKDIAIEQLSDGSVKSYGWLNTVIRFSLEQEGWPDAVVKMKIGDKDVAGFSINLRKDVECGASGGDGCSNNSGMSWNKLRAEKKKGEVKCKELPPEVNRRIFDKLQDGQNKVAFYVEGRPTLKIDDALIYRWSSKSTGHTRPCFNGAVDTIFVEGSVTNSGMFVNLSNSSKCLMEDQRITDVKIRINGCAVPGFSIKLDRLRQKKSTGMPTDELTPQENQQIFKHLHEGMNSITFYIEGHPDSEIHANIYNWKPNSKVVIVDIDGTLTMSNGLGMVKNFTREDYFHPGICKLLWQIKLRGYEILYLTARPISTIHATRRLLGINVMEVKECFQPPQENIEKPPPGPVHCCCYGRFPTSCHYLGNLVIGRKEFSHKDFKTDYLSKISIEVFRKKDVLFAGFGDSKFDFDSYELARIPDHRNFQVQMNGAILVSDKEDAITDFDLDLHFPSNAM